MVRVLGTCFATGGSSATSEEPRRSVSERRCTEIFYCRTLEKEPSIKCKLNTQGGDFDEWHIECLLAGEPLRFVGASICFILQFPAQNFALKDEPNGMHLAVWVLEDLRINFGDGIDHHIQPRLLLHFSNRGIRRVLPELNATAGKRPPPFKIADDRRKTAEQNPVIVLQEHIRGNSGDLGRGHHPILRRARLGAVNDTSALIRAYFHAFNDHDAESLLALLDENVRHDINEGNTEYGVDAFRKFKAHMDDCYREQITDLVVMVNGERGAAEFTCSGKYLKTDGSLPPATGQEYSIWAAAFFEVSKGKITRITSCYNLKNWIQAIQA